MNPNDFPTYWDVDDVLVKIDYDADTDEVFAMTAGGKEYPIAKARFEGEPSTEEAFNARVEKVGQSTNPSATAAS